MKHSAGGIVVGPQGKIVLVHQQGDSWSFPKGHVEEGESPLQAALREIKEETGLTVEKPIQEFDSYERYSIGKGGVGEDIAGGLKQMTFFLFQTTESKFHTHDPTYEITDVRWVLPSEVSLLLTHQKDREFFESVRATLEEWIPL